MSKGLGTYFSKKAAVLATGLAVLTPTFGAQMDRINNPDEIKPAAAWKAGVVSVNQIVIHAHDDYLGPALAMHNVLEKNGYPTEVFSGRADSVRPFELFVGKESIGEFTLKQSTALPGMAVENYNTKIANNLGEKGQEIAMGDRKPSDPSKG